MSRKVTTNNFIDGVWTMRKVIYSEYVEHKKEDGKRYWELEPKGSAVFHQFGCNYDEFENGVGNFSTAIIEIEGGVVKNIPVENIVFID